MWDKREKEWEMERQARRKLMEDVIATQQRQVGFKSCPSYRRVLISTLHFSGGRKDPICSSGTRTAAQGSGGDRRFPETLRRGAEIPRSGQPSQADASQVGSTGPDGGEKGTTGSRGIQRGARPTSPGAAGGCQRRETLGHRHGPIETLKSPKSILTCPSAILVFMCFKISFNMFVVNTNYFPT